MYFPLNNENKQVPTPIIDLDIKCIGFHDDMAEFSPDNQQYH